MSVASITSLAAPAINSALNVTFVPDEESLQTPEQTPASLDSVQLSDEAHQLAKTDQVQPSDDSPPVAVPEAPIDTAVLSDDPIEVSAASTDAAANAQEMLDESATPDSDTSTEAIPTTEAVLNPDEIQSITVYDGAPESTADLQALFRPMRPLSELPIFSAASFGLPSRGSANRAVEHDHGEEPPHHDHEDDPFVTEAISEHALLPDLVPWTPYTQNARVILDRDSGKKLLSFGTTIANKGKGPMELDIGGTKADERRPAFQLIRNDDGTETRIPVGEFYWHDAPGHNHYHFDEFALYQLREIDEDGQPGAIAAEGHKAGFCLMDSLQSHPDTPNSSVVPRFRGTSCSEGKKMGISPGWADHYAARQGLQLLDGQFIEIDDVPPGEYYLEIVTDPANRLIESNEENNHAFVKVKLD